MECKVLGCKNKLDNEGIPVEYCDYQQGRCPMQKKKPDAVGYTVVGLMYLLLFLIIWLTI